MRTREMRTGLRRAVAVVALLAALATAGAAHAADGGVNLNTATQEELLALPGVGPAKAKAIIDYRNAHPFKSVEEVKNVRGIGDHMFESLKGKISVGPVASSGTAAR
jgi:competence protein ComEA